MKNKIWLSSPHMGGHEEDFVKQAFIDNWVAPLGPNVDGFENDLQNYLDTGINVAALSSGTAALHLALILLGVERGDEVICQSLTFAASANPISYLGAIPIFVDSEMDTWNLCPIQLENAIEDRIKRGNKPKAIVGVHLYGMPFKVEAIKEISEKYSIPLIEDSAEALGSTYKGLKCGTFGHMSILSFNGNKIITTSGGGALVSWDAALVKKAVFLATQARDDAPHYQHSHVGYNYRMSNICAGIGRGQMMILDKHIQLRRNHNQFYRNLFNGVKGVEVFAEPDSHYFSNHWLTCIVIDPNLTNGVDAYKLKHALEVENIESRPVWKPMHMQPVFKDFPFYGGNVAEHLFKYGLCLPSSSNLSEADLIRITLVVKQIFN
jgi:dTDP-4-amino-4,6-dideoxygalactose transaminase